MSNWYDLDKWDAAGAAAEYASEGMKNVADAVSELATAAKASAQQGIDSAAQSIETVKAWEKVTTTLQNELTAADTRLGNPIPWKSA